MKNPAKILNMVFDCLSEPVLLIDEKNKPIYANQALHIALNEHFKKELKPEQFVELLNFNIKSSSSEHQIQELETQGSSERLKLKIYNLPENYILIKLLPASPSHDLKRNLHTQRIETLGLLAGGVAHDFNNILTGLLGHVTYLKNVLPQAGSHALSIKAIEEGTKRASSLTREIPNYARMEPNEKPKRVELRDLIEKTYNLLRGAISPQYEVSYAVPDDPVYILADEAKVAQIVVNLAINARDAINKGGFIKMELAVVHNEEELKKVFVDKELSVSHYACLRVTDDGTGMSKDVLKHVFEPYFTTKNEKGTGLGLAIVHEIVHMFSGAIHIDTKLRTVKEKGGTSIAIYFPMLGDFADHKDQTDKDKPLELSRGTGRILVVDDEQPVRNVLSLSLEHLGYTVTCAASGSEAIEIYKNSNNSFDLVLLDMLMPHMTGDQTFFALKEFDPNVKVLLISGYSSPEAVSSVLDNGGLGIIQKPFTISDLALRVRQCL